MLRAPPTTCGSTFRWAPTFRHSGSGSWTSLPTQNVRAVPPPADDLRIAVLPIVNMMVPGPRRGIPDEGRRTKDEGRTKD